MNVPITVTGLTVTVQSAGANGCDPAWFGVTQSTLSSAQTLTVAANSTLSVPTSNLPSIRMIDSHTLQDACKGTKLTLAYSGTAHS
jgi:hypothetical protein